MKFRHDKAVSPKKSGLKLALIIAAVLTVFGLAAFVGLQNWYQDNLKSVDPNNQNEVSFVVEPGTPARDIASSLEEQELIRNANVFTWYVDREGIRDELQAGTYRFSQSMSVQEIAEHLASGDVATDFVTIFPVRRVDQIRDDLIEAGFSAEDVDAALSNNYQHPLLADKPNNATLEGYLFPETYNLPSENSLNYLFETSFDQFYKQITPTDLTKLKKQGLNLHEAVILASIVAKESGNDQDRPKIASVFYNRLEQGIALGSDATFVYAAALLGVSPTPELDDPYNTRIYKGLPPGPISNFNFSAFEAVVNPADTDFLYFVSGDDGKNYFAKTLDEHERNIQLYCKENCILPDKVE